MPALPAPYLTAVATNVVHLYWRENSSKEKSFVIERAMSENGPWVQIAKVARNTTSYTDANTKPSTTYFYRVYASSQ